MSSLAALGYTRSMHSSLAIHAKNSSLSSMLQIFAATATKVGVSKIVSMRECTSGTYSVQVGPTKVSVVGPNEVLKKHDFDTQRYEEGADLDFLRGKSGSFVPKDNH